MKKFIQKIFNFFGYKVMKSRSIDISDLNLITQFLIIKSNPVILDVGANKGQSITRYKKLFQSPVIHSFEPNIDEINILKKNIIMIKIYF